MNTVLVVDDDRSYLDGLIATLSRFKNEFTLRTAENGEQAVKILQSDSVQMLITALDLPVMDGFELLAFVLQKEPSAEIVVVGTADSGRIGHALTADGAFRYLQKPVAAQHLLDLIREIFAQRAQGHVKGLSLSGFLQLLNSERRTCCLAVRSGDKTGRVHMLEGEVINAVYRGVEGRRALYHLLKWERPEIDVETYSLATRKRIRSPLARLLLEAAVGRDGSDAIDDILYSEPRLVPEATRFENRPGSEPPATAAGATWVERTEDRRSPRHPPPALGAAELAVVRKGLAQFLALEGAIGAALVDTSTATCLAAASHSSEAGFAEAACRAAEVAQARLRAMQGQPLGTAVRQLKLYRPEEFGLVRFLRSKPNLLLYFAGERGRVDPAEASNRLAALEEQISG